MCTRNLISIQKWEERQKKNKEAEDKSRPAVGNIDAITEIRRKKDESLGRSLNRNLRSALFLPRCLMNCPAEYGCYESEENDCFVLHQHNQDLARDFSVFKDSCEHNNVNKEQEYFCPPVEFCFVDKMEMDSIHKILRKFWAYFLKDGDEGLPYELSHLPKRKILEPGTLSSGHIVRFQTPSDFHMILDDFSCYNHALKENGWDHYFRKDSKVFHSTNQIFRGITILLSLFMRYVESASDTNPETITYKPGDVVVAAILRQDDALRPSYVAYRGYIIKSVTALNEDLTKVDGYIVYLLDTGEQHIVSSLYLRPIPIQFLGFAPLAIPCALHGVSPIGEKWNKAACDLMRKSINPNCHVVAEFYSKKDPHKKDCTVPFVNEKPYFVELTVQNQRAEQTCVRNVSSILIREKVALEWTLCPHRPALRCSEKPKRLLPHHTDPGDKRVPALDREEALLCVGPVPQPVTQIPEEQALQEAARLFSIRKEHFNNVFIPKMTNILCMRMADPHHSLGEKCIPPLFLEVKAGSDNHDNEGASATLPGIEFNDGSKEAHGENEEPVPETDANLVDLDVRMEDVDVDESDENWTLAVQQVYEKFEILKKRR